jgi:tight adherence protein B
MTALLLTGMIFVITLGLTLSGMYFLVEAPAARRRVRQRLAAIQQSTSRGDSEEMGILREEVMSQVPALDRLLLHIPIFNKLQVTIQQAAMQTTAATLLLIALAVAFLVFLIGFLFGLPLILLVVVVALAAMVPFMVVSFKRYRRFSKFEEMFPDAIELLARAVRAGHAFTTGLELIAREMPEPVAGEFRATYEQQNFGLPLRDALQNLQVRVPLPDVAFFISALQIQRESGGNLAEILDNLSFVIRERFKILRQVKVYTAQGRMTLYILTGLPPATAFLLYLANPKYMGILFTDPLGHKAIAVAVVLQVIGFFIIKKVIRIRV